MMTPQKKSIFSLSVWEKPSDQIVEKRITKFHTGTQRKCLGARPGDGLGKVDSSVVQCEE